MRTSWANRIVLVGAVVVLGISGTAGSSGAPVPAAEARAGSARLDGEECRVLDTINRFRRRHGLGRLELSLDLTEAADFHSRDMARRNYFDHTLKGGTEWWDNIRNFGYKSNPIGENIAAGPAGASGAFKLWKNSRSHRENMLRRSFGAIGIGRAYDRGSKYGWYWTTTFGSRVERKIACR